MVVNQSWYLPKPLESWQYIVNNESTNSVGNEGHLEIGPNGSAALRFDQDPRWRCLSQKLSQNLPNCLFPPRFSQRHPTISFPQLVHWPQCNCTTALRVVCGLLSNGLPWAYWWRLSQCTREGWILGWLLVMVLVGVPPQNCELHIPFDPALNLKPQSQHVRFLSNWDGSAATFTGVTCRFRQKNVQILCPLTPDRGNRPWKPTVESTEVPKWVDPEKHSQQLVTDELVDDTGINS